MTHDHPPPDTPKILEVLEPFVDFCACQMRFGANDFAHRHDPHRGHGLHDNLVRRDYKISVFKKRIGITQANLFDAIRQRRTFARSSSYLSAMYTVNGQPMGSILPGMGPFELNLQATYAIPAGITATPRNICNIELWAASNRDVNGQFNRSTLKTWVNQPAQPSMEPTFKGSDCPCRLFGLRILHTTRSRGPVHHR